MRIEYIIYEQNVQNYHSLNLFKHIKQNMLMIIFAAKLRDIISQRHRKYHDILNGAPAYAETVMYRIAKFEGRLTESQAATRTPIQNFWVPDTNETE